MRFQLVSAFLFCGLISSGAYAQSGSLAFSGMAIDAKAPVDVAADQLSVNQADGSAVFSGNVEVAQGDLKLTAGEIQIEYGPEVDGTSREISRLLASGGVTMVTPTEAAEASEAVYSLADGTITLIGNVMAVQGLSAISGDKMVIDLATGTGSVEGRVRTTLQSGGGN